MTTLKSLVDETTNIKNELVECRDALTQILINKKIENLGSENKLSALINEVSNIPTVSTCEISDNILFSCEYNKSIGFTALNQFQVMWQIPSFFNGSCRVSYTYNGTSAGSSYYITCVQVIRDGKQIYESQRFTTNTTSRTCVVDLYDIKFLDVIRVAGIVNTDNRYIQYKNLYIKGNLR